MTNKSVDHFFGRNVSYAQDNHEIYTRLMSDPLSPFKGKNMSDIFTYAAVMGFKNNTKTRLKKPKPNIPVAALTKTQKSILLTIAITDDSRGIDILFDVEKATEIVEQYANGGVDLLETYLLGNVNIDAIDKMSSDMMRMID